MALQCHLQHSSSYRQSCPWRMRESIPTKSCTPRWPPCLAQNAALSHRAYSGDRRSGWAVSTRQVFCGLQITVAKLWADWGSPSDVHTKGWNSQQNSMQKHSWLGMRHLAQEPLWYRDKLFFFLATLANPWQRLSESTGIPLELCAEHDLLAFSPPPLSSPLPRILSSLGSHGLCSHGHFPSPSLATASASHVVLSLHRTTTWWNVTEPCSLLQLYGPQVISSSPIASSTNDAPVTLKEKSPDPPPLPENSVSTYALSTWPLNLYVQWASQSKQGREGLLVLAPDLFFRQPSCLSKWHHYPPIFTRAPNLALSLLSSCPHHCPSQQVLWQYLQTVPQCTHCCLLPWVPHWSKPRLFLLGLF